jgi:DNA-binding MarR family transcriptional regulator
MGNNGRPRGAQRGYDTLIEPRWLDSVEMEAWLSFVQTQSDLLTALEQDLASTGLTLGDYQVFVYLSEAPDQSMRMCDLADILQLSPSGVTRRLDGLVRGGLVERRNSDADRRVMLAVLTDAGRERLAEAAPIHVESVRARIIDRLDRADLEAMAQIFTKIRAGLDS